MQFAIDRAKANCYSEVMKLIEYVKSRGSQRDLADKIGITPVLISQWANELRPVPPERCVEIERATGGQVTRKDLRPEDWHKIWPELVVAAQATPIAAPRRATDPEPPPAPDRPFRQPSSRKNVMELHGLNGSRHYVSVPVRPATSDDAGALDPD
jgi:DNA-binding transcriptional regulator YdaS (Cro superfamily)